MSSGSSKRRFFTRDASPVVASDEDFDAVFGPMAERSSSIAQDIPIERIRPNPFQARVKFNDIESLAATMRAHGFTSRLRVRRDPEQPQFFQLVYGERRLRAAKAAGIGVVPCDVAEHSDAEMREIGLTENLQRSDLEPLEEARAFRVAMDREHYSIRSLAAQIGKSKGYVQSRLDLLRAPTDVIEMVDQHPETFTAGLLIGQLPTAELRAPLIARVVAGEIDKETVRAIVRDVLATGALPAPASGAYRADITAALSRAPESSTGDGPATKAERNRAARLSARALKRAAQTLDTLLTHLQQIVPELQANERAQLRDVLREQHLPAIEQLLQDLDEPPR